MTKPPTDIQTAPWPELSWAAEARTAPLERLAAHVTTEGQAAIRWYIARKRPKQLWVRLLRGLALLFAALQVGRARSAGPSRQGQVGRAKSAGPSRQGQVGRAKSAGSASPLSTRA
jgi:hypothetical protein